MELKFNFTYLQKLPKPSFSREGEGESEREEEEEEEMENTRQYNLIVVPITAIGELLLSLFRGSSSLPSEGWNEGNLLMALWVR